MSHENTQPQQMALELPDGSPQRVLQAAVRVSRRLSEGAQAQIDTSDLHSLVQHALQTLQPEQQDEAVALAFGAELRRRLAVHPSRCTEIANEQSERALNERLRQQLQAGDPRDVAIAAMHMWHAGVRVTRSSPYPVVWPQAKDVGRLDDMHPQGNLRVGLDADNDVYISVFDGASSAALEFCNPGGGGGGASERTRLALIALMVAMEEDNRLRPDKDWWALRRDEKFGRMPGGG